MNLFILIPTLFGWLFLIILFTVIVRESWQYRRLSKLVRCRIYCSYGRHKLERCWNTKDPATDKYQCSKCDLYQDEILKMVKD